MSFKRNVAVLLSGTVLGTCLVATAPAVADEADLQRQINAMQRQLKAMQEQLAKDKSRKQGDKDKKGESGEALAAAVPAPKDADITFMPGWMVPLVPWATPPLGGIHTSMAGTFIALEGAWRERNEVASGASSPPFGIPGIPLPNSPLYHQNEFRMTAQQSRIAFRTWGDITPTQRLEAYFEMDFLSASVDANNRESNSFTPRIRQAFASYDNDDYHIHFLAGQAWSLLTQNRVGITPRFENVPLTIDAQYVVGFNWLRNPQIRMVTDWWNHTAWFGISVEQPGVVFPGAPEAAQVNPPGLLTNINNFCTTSSHLNGSTTCSNDVAPDIIEKFALDPGWGHYEILALQRWLTNSVTPATLVDGQPTTPLDWNQKTAFGWGVGGSFLVPALPRYLDLQGSILYGDAIGRYSSSQLPDAVIGQSGGLAPLTGLQFLVGAVGHPWDGLDIYTYYGQDRVYGNSWSIGGVNGGYGNPLFHNDGCLLQGPGAGQTGGALLSGSPFNTPFPNTTCTFDVQRTQEFTIGLWQTLYRGPLGRAVVGLQYAYIQVHAFGGSPMVTGPFSTPNQGLNPDNNIFMFSFRYYPFN